jgi:MYXO-CTERM domain-containing protein
MPICQTMSTGLGSGVGGSGAAPTTGVRPASTPPERVIQEDTTQPRVTLADQGNHDGGCSATQGREHARWGALGIAGLACLALLRRRRSSRRA